MNTFTVFRSGYLGWSDQRRAARAARAWRRFEMACLALSILGGGWAVLSLPWPVAGR